MLEIKHIFLDVVQYILSYGFGDRKPLGVVHWAPGRYQRNGWNHQARPCLSFFSSQLLECHKLQQKYPLYKQTKHGKSMKILPPKTFHNLQNIQSKVMENPYNYKPFGRFHVTNPGLVQGLSLVFFFFQSVTGSNHSLTVCIPIVSIGHENALTQHDTAMTQWLLFWQIPRSWKDQNQSNLKNQKGDNG